MRSGNKIVASAVLSEYPLVIKKPLIMVRQLAVMDTSDFGSSVMLVVEVQLASAATSITLPHVVPAIKEDAIINNT